MSKTVKNNNNNKKIKYIFQTNYIEKYLNNDEKKLFTEIKKEFDVSIIEKRTYSNTNSKLYYNEYYIQDLNIINKLSKIIYSLIIKSMETNEIEIQKDIINFCNELSFYNFIDEEFNELLGNYPDELDIKHDQIIYNQFIDSFESYIKKHNKKGNKK